MGGNSQLSALRTLIKQNNPAHTNVMANGTHQPVTSVSRKPNTAMASVMCMRAGYAGKSKNRQSSRTNQIAKPIQMANISQTPSAPKSNNSGDSKISNSNSLVFMRRQCDRQRRGDAPNIMCNKHAALTTHTAAGMVKIAACRLPSSNAPTVPSAKPSCMEARNVMTGVQRLRNDDGRINDARLGAVNTDRAATGHAMTIMRTSPRSQPQKAAMTAPAPMEFLMCMSGAYHYG